jgi:ABC-type Fe3+/spermidine/putrescine transport system ATPase subunit
MSQVILEGVSKRYGSFVALDKIDLVVREGEFVTLLGPSGCGKTTTLRIIAGFVTPSGGEVYIGSERVTNLPGNKRNTGLVFQNFALFPHLSVAENVAFGLRVRKVPPSEIRGRVREALSMVHLESFEDRLPRALSGGQQQRVALARAVVIRPQVLLLDEPLSALDLKLRQELQVYIKEIQRALRITTVYVTHDQGEALRLSDRIVVMKDGQIEQIALPVDLYKLPKTSFVAKFVGEMNFLAVKVLSREGNLARCLFPEVGSSPLCAVFRADAPPPGAGDEMLLGFRPEAATLKRLEGNAVQTIVRKIEYRGASWSVALETKTGATILVEIPAAEPPPHVGDVVSAYWRASDCFLLPAEPLGRK